MNHRKELGEKLTFIVLWQPLGGLLCLFRSHDTFCLCTAAWEDNIEKLIHLDIKVELTFCHCRVGSVSSLSCHFLSFDIVIVYEKYIAYENYRYWYITSYPTDRLTTTYGWALIRYRARYWQEVSRLGESRTGFEITVYYKWCPKYIISIGLQLDVTLG